MQSIHPGYLLPVVRGFFVASIGFSTVHAHSAAMAAFGIGASFWLVIGTVVTVRLMTGGELCQLPVGQEEPTTISRTCWVSATQR
ncbi:UNVERIFIED_ORG: tellurite resistance protein TehA-like permease [Arthrobacter sp. UYEF10]|uniref:hypothetical protein n=1 Tax=Pseudarthrobacter sp. Y6 TaxID=3418422 RepID=UPI003399FBA0